MQNGRNLYLKKGENSSEDGFFCEKSVKKFECELSKSPSYKGTVYVL